MSVVIRPRLFLLEPQIVFSAQVTLLSAADYPVEFVAYHNVTAGDYTAIRPGMTLVLGTTPGASDLGRQMVTEAASAIAIPVGYSSEGIYDGELTVVNDTYITVWADHRLWAKMSFIDTAGGIFKSTNLDVEWRTTTPPPVANCGGGFAGTVSEGDGHLTVQVFGDGSFAVAEGATLVSYFWEIGDGEFVGADTEATINPTLKFPPGFRYIYLTVTDSNGHTHTASCPIFADSLFNTLSFAGFEMDDIRIADNGCTVSLKITQNAPRTTYPDGTLCMVWEQEPATPASRDHMLVVGWLDQEDVSVDAGKYGLVKDTTIAVLDGGARLNQLPGFPQTVADDATRDTELLPDMTWNYMIDPTMDKYIHYLLQWHSTALEVLDYTPSGTGATYSFILKGSDGESLFAQVSDCASAMLPGYILTATPLGQLMVVRDPQLWDTADRTNTVQTEITEADWTRISYQYQRNPKIHWLRRGAVGVQTEPTFNDDGTLNLPTYFSIAPGKTPGQGLGESEDTIGLVDSQATLNATTGHQYARMNNPVPTITATLIQNDAVAGSTIPWREIQPALKEWVQLGVSTGTAGNRGAAFANMRCLPKEVSIRYTNSKGGRLREVQVTLEPETVGKPGILDPKDTDVLPVGEQPEVIPPTTPPTDGMVTGQQLVAGIDEGGGVDGFIYRTFDFQTPDSGGGPTWERLLPQPDGGVELFSFVVDPFSPGYVLQNGTGAINGWIATGSKIYRVTDIFGETPACTAQYTFAVALGSDPDYVDRNNYGRSIQASFGRYFDTQTDNPWLMCVSHYKDTAGHTGTWAVYSKDAGQTWSDEIQISEYYNSSTASGRPYVTPGVYLSPKTPGLAYTAAYIETDTTAQALGFVSLDWGETWTQITESLTEDPAAPIPHWGILDTSDAFVGTRVGGTCSVTAIAAVADTASKTQTWKVLLAPPANAVRVLLSGHFENSRTQVHTAPTPAPAFSNTYSLNTAGSTSMSETLTFATGTVNGDDSSQDYTVEWVREFGTDWHGNRDEMAATTPTSTTGYCAFTVSATASTGGDNESAINILRHTATIVEIELEDGTIYTPGVLTAAIDPNQGLAGDIHSPWPSNDDEAVVYFGHLTRGSVFEYRLKRTEADGSVTDISPTYAGRTYGPNKHSFSIRTFDNDRSYAVMGGFGNGVSANRVDDTGAVFVSTDGGDTWTRVFGPLIDDDAFVGLSAAFAADDANVLYLWGGSFGGSGTIMYSTDFGVSWDDRSGNIAADWGIGGEPSGFVALVGGPITA
jgi:hypothetical protein